MLTFEQANEQCSSYEIICEFGIDGHYSICFDCERLLGCRARKIFEINYPGETIKRCKYFKEEAE